MAVCWRGGEDREGRETSEGEGSLPALVKTTTTSSNDVNKKNNEKMSNDETTLKKEVGECSCSKASKIIIASLLKSDHQVRTDPFTQFLLIS